ncbi:MAG: hypothetical protein A2X28_02805 [Elusimicrobia bacterium GWA2_56_46]|nr:MAG: hypothetical protein A2X28_02805 [Elusimicrobia bacterium GWA2_56_46]OGR55312.1 MAG: hypothetical protein A2X39_00160 [Elusimicrobia bacterium GWC2_56_31]HBW22534.1 hypothetical protein [Elusimicrobiota bacterium]
MDRIEAQKVFRDNATNEAKEELKTLGFRPDAATRWNREATPASGGQAISVTIPDRFPDSLPEIFVSRGQLSRRIPHVEPNGKICIAQEGAVLLDTGRPRAIVRDAIKLAEITLTRGLAGELDADLHEEFLAYWNRGCACKIIWFSPIRKEAGEITLVALDVGDSNFCKNIVGPSYEEIDAWAKKINKRVRSFGKAFFIPLHTPFPPPDFDEQLSVEGFLEQIEDLCDTSDFDALIEWLTTVTTPATIIVSIPATDKSGSVLFGFAIPRIDSLYHTRMNLRPKHAAQDIEYMPGMPIKRIEVERHDSDFITTRGGAFDILRTKTVAVIGCGALGSQAAKCLALAGVGKLRLIDPETFAPENLHRHLLGAGWIGTSKVVGIEKELSSALPNLTVEARPHSAEQVLHDEPAFILGSSAILIATGDETLDRVLNDLLVDGPPSIFSWIEPLGIGGHALSTRNSGERGCFECLYEPINGVRLGNVSSFVRHGQELARSFAGCAGRFMPFSALDAIRTATEASRLVIEALAEDSPKNTLVSWYGDPQALIAAGFTVSDRAARFLPGQTIRTSNFARLDCKICG